MLAAHGIGFAQRAPLTGARHVRHPFSSARGAAATMPNRRRRSRDDILRSKRLIVCAGEVLVRVTDAGKTHDGDRYQFTSLGCVMERGQRVAGACSPLPHRKFVLCGQRLATLPCMVPWRLQLP